MPDPGSQKDPATLDGARFGLSSWRTMVGAYPGLEWLADRETGEESDAADGTLEFRGFQQAAVLAWHMAGCRGVIRSATGSGKTLIVAAIAASMHPLKTLVVVHGRQLLRQTAGMLSALLPEGTVGTISGGSYDPRQVTVASIDTLAYYLGDLSEAQLEGLGEDFRRVHGSRGDEFARFLAEDVDVLVMDEVHHGSSDTWQDVGKRCGAFYRVGLSGTPLKGEELADMRLMAMIGPVVFDLDTPWLQRNGYLSPARLIVRRCPWPVLGARKMDYRTARREILVGNPGRWAALAADVAGLLRDPASRVLVLTGNSVDLATGIASALEALPEPGRGEWEVVTGKTSAKRTEAAFKGLRDGSLRCLVTTKLADEGIDVPDVNVLVLCGGGKCLGRGTLVLTAAGGLKRVEEVQVGDLLMGPDSESRTVRAVSTGFGKLCRIVPLKGEPWVCNLDHVLTLVYSMTGEVLDIPVAEYVDAGNRYREWRLFIPESVRFPEIEPSKVDPYFLGLWFGDGLKDLKRYRRVGITTVDDEVKEYCSGIAASYGLTFTPVGRSRKDYKLTNPSNRGHAGSNKLLRDMMELVGEEALVPDAVRLGSYETRLGFLAGFLDADGHLHHGFFEVIQKREDYTDALSFISRSLGFRTTCREKIVNGSMYYRLNILGDVSRVPTRVARKKAAARRQIKNARRTGFDVVPVGAGEYFGFELDGDGRFLLGDFTVTHNSYVSAVQRVGRGLRRKDGGGGLLVVDHHTLGNRYLEKHDRARLKTYRESGAFSEITVEDVDAP